MSKGFFETLAAKGRVEGAGAGGAGGAGGKAGAASAAAAGLDDGALDAAGWWVQFL